MKYYFPTTLTQQESPNTLTLVLSISNILSIPKIIPTAVGIILGIDRILDMLRTSVNVFGDSCCVSVVGK